MSVKKDLNYRSTSHYMRKKFKIGTIATPSIGLKKKMEMKDQLINDHTKSELRTLKAGINSQYETYKQMNIIFGVFVMFFSFITVFFTLSTPLTFKSLDWIVKEKGSTQQIDINNVIETLNNAVSSLQDVFTKLSGYVFSFYCIAIFIYLIRYRWISAVNFIINEAYEEKKELEEKEKKIESEDLRLYSHKSPRSRRKPIKGRRKAGYHY